MWLGLALTLVGPPLMLALVVFMEHVENYVEGSPEPLDRLTEGATASVTPSPQPAAQVIWLDRVLPPLPREPVGEPLDGAGRPLAR